MSFGKIICATVHSQAPTGKDGLDGGDNDCGEGRSAGA